MQPQNGQGHKPGSGDQSGDQIIIVRPEENFTMLPNDMVRGMGVWAGLTLQERGMLAALLSMRTGWRLSNATLARLAPELGRDGLATVMRGLSKLGFVRHIRSRGEDGTFVWRWVISSYPQDKPSEAGKRGKRGNTTHGKPASGRDQHKHSVSPGRTTYGSAVHGQPVDIRRPEVQEDQENPPSPPPPDRQPPRQPGRKTGGGADEGSKTNGTGTPVPSQELVDTADEIQRRRPTWGKTAIVEALTTCVVDGRDQATAVRALTSLADGNHGHTRSPMRVTRQGPWWDDADGRPSPTPPPLTKAAPRYQPHTYVPPLADERIPSGYRPPPVCQECGMPRTNRIHAAG